jgi:nucleoside-diphosphate-sugar epimerase
MYQWNAATLGNMQRDSAGGGVLIDFGSHMIDLMFALFDEPAEIINYSDNSLGGIESDCSIDLRVRHCGQPLEGCIELARTRDLGCLIRVECERSTLELQVNERFRVKVLPRDAELIDPLSGTVRDVGFDASWLEECEDESWYATFGRQYDDWVASIQSGGKPALSGQSSLATCRLIEACYNQRQLTHEPWVWRGISSCDAPPGRSTASHVTGTSGNGQPAPPNVHTGGRGGRILVTGATGFIGCRVVELLRLREKCDVCAVVHNPANASRLARLDVELLQADLGSVEGARQLVQGCDGVVHCAIGTEWGEPRKIYDVTVGGTRRLAEAALAAGVKRFVHVSTMSVYGDENIFTGTLDENTPVRPVRGSLYGETKAAAEQAVLGLSHKGLSAVVLRPARVYGPFSRIFIVRPLQAIAAGYFEWIGPPDVPADMVYVDNVAESMLSALFADADRVAGEAFNVGDGDSSTWREFYAYFADRLGLDLANVPVSDPSASTKRKGIGSLFSFPRRFARGVGEVVTSQEFKSLGRRVLMTDPIGTMPRKALERHAALERGVRRMIKADDALPVYRPDSGAPGETVQMGSGGAILSIEKLRDRLGFVPPASRAEALQLTLDWVRHARIV